MKGLNFGMGSDPADDSSSDASREVVPGAELDTADPATPKENLLESALVPDAEPDAEPDAADPQTADVNPLGSSGAEPEAAGCCVCSLPAPALVPCGHPLCAECRQSLRHKLCPLCRAELSGSESESSDDSCPPMTHQRALRPTWTPAVAVDSDSDEEAHALAEEGPERASAAEERENPGEAGEEEGLGGEPGATLRARTEAFLAEARALFTRRASDPQAEPAQD